MWITFRCKLRGEVDQFWMQFNSFMIVAFGDTISRVTFAGLRLFLVGFASV